MSQALYTSKTGIVAGQTQIDVVANNVANMNTTAYKTANVTFSTLFSKTLSAGSAATTNGGGTNPKQIGLGTQVSSISRNFESGSFQSTGIASDLMISGNGYFVVQEGNDGAQYFTRDGHFSLDDVGNLVTSTGLKVVGSTSEYSTFSSNATIKIPTMLNVSLMGTKATDLATRTLEQLNAANITTGVFRLNIGGTTSSVPASAFEVDNANPNKYNTDLNGDGNTDVVYSKLDMATLTTADRANLTELYGDIEPTDIFFKGDNGTYIKGEIPTAGNVTVKNMQQFVEYRITDGDLNSTLQDFVTSVNNSFNAQGYGDLQLKVIDGGLQLDNNTGVDISVADEQSTNFLGETGLSDAIETGTATQTAYYSGDINQSATIANSYNSANAIKKQSWTISENGVVSVKYNDGSSLTVNIGKAGYSEWEYTTPDNVVIRGSGSENSDLDMTETGLTTANMVMQLGVVINDAGLVAETDNLWSIGPNAGEFAYGMSGANGFGNLKSGGLEGSNVDMATELSNMILAQRLIQANSRVFGTASSVLEQLGYLGQ